MEGYEMKRGPLIVGFFMLVFEVFFRFGFIVGGRVWRDIVDGREEKMVGVWDGKEEGERER